MNTGWIGSFRFKKINRIWIAATSLGLCRIELSGKKKDFLELLPDSIEWVHDDGRFKKLFKLIEGYLAGRDRSFPVKLQVDGTDFQKRVWAAIAKIPYGTTISYAELARKTGRVRAVRAVANACGKNPIPIIIPCHRVIASDGSIGGFSSGIGMKKRLLLIEGILLR